MKATICDACERPITEPMQAEYQATIGETKPGHHLGKVTLKLVKPADVDICLECIVDAVTKLQKPSLERTARYLQAISKESPQ